MVGEQLTTMTLPIPQEEVDWLEAKGFIIRPTLSSDLIEWRRTLQSSQQYVTLSLPTARRPGHSFAVYTIDSGGMHIAVEHTEGHQSVYSAYATAELRGWRRAT